jgi:hypothetical protein
MRRPERSFTGNDSAGEQALYMAMELSNRQWKLGFTDRRHKIRRVSVEARIGLPEDAPVFSCYEAGRDGFWLHRYLVSCGINNQVLEPSSIKVDRRRRRAKTDRLDVERMLRQLLRHLDGDTEELHVVRVPTPEQEDGRRWRSSSGGALSRGRPHRCWRSCSSWSGGARRAVKAKIVMAVRDRSPPYTRMIRWQIVSRAFCRPMLRPAPR